MKIFKTLLSLLVIFISFTDISAQVVETNRVYYNNEIRLTNNKFVFTTENVFWMDGKNTYKFDVYSYKSVEDVKNAMTSKMSRWLMLPSFFAFSSSCALSASRSGLGSLGTGVLLGD
jgi:hypothetical protein